MIQTIIRDFQSIEEAKITIKGVTLIVGESNQGKSACLRAIQAACTNRFKAGQVRHGRDFAVIRVKTEESPDILTVARSWSGGSPQIQLGQRKFSKLGRTLPKEVADFLKLGFVDLNGETYSCNFHPQFQKPMLLEYSQQKVMEILSASTALDDLKETKEELMSVRAKNKGAISAVEGIIVETTSKLHKTQQRLNEFIPIYEEFSNKFAGYEVNETILEDANTLKESVDVFVSLVEKETKQNNYINLIVALKELDDKMVKLIKVEELLKSLHDLNVKSEVYNSIVEVYDEDLEESITRVYTIESMLSLESNLELKDTRLTNKLEVLQKIIKCEDTIQSYNNSRLLLDQLETNVRSIDILCASESSLKKVVEEHQCPICGNKVNI